jgi:hypothetical protein
MKMPVTKLNMEFNPERIWDHAIPHAIEPLTTNASVTGCALPMGGKTRKYGLRYAPYITDNTVLAQQFEPSITPPASNIQLHLSNLPPRQV